MSSNFPTSLDSFTNPGASDTLNSPSHSAQHANANDAIEALEAKVGIDGSAVSTSLDKRVSVVEGASFPGITVAQGDILHRATAGNGALSSLAIGSANKVLTSNGTVPTWAYPIASSATVYNDATQAINSGAFAALTFNQEEHDTDGYHSTSSNTSRLTIPTNGKYLIMGQVVFTASTTTGVARLLQLKLNNATTLTYAGAVNPAISGIESFCQTQTIVNLTAGDYVELFAYTNQGSISALAGLYQTQFSIMRIGT